MHKKYVPTHIYLANTHKIEMTNFSFNQFFSSHFLYLLFTFGGRTDENRKEGENVFVSCCDVKVYVSVCEGMKEMRMRRINRHETSIVKYS